MVILASILMKMLFGYLKYIKFAELVSEICHLIIDLLLENTNLKESSANALLKNV